MRDIVGTVHINNFLRGCTIVGAHPDHSRGGARSSSKLFIWTVPTISLTEAPPHELILARWRGGDCGRPKARVRPFSQPRIKSYYHIIVSTACHAPRSKRLDQAHALPLCVRRASWAPGMAIGCPLASFIHLSLILSARVLLRKQPWLRRLRRLRPVVARPRRRCARSVPRTPASCLLPANLPPACCAGDHARDESRVSTFGQSGSVRVQGGCVHDGYQVAGAVAGCSAADGARRAACGEWRTRGVAVLLLRVATRSPPFPRSVALLLMQPPAPLTLTEVVQGKGQGEAVQPCPLRQDHLREDARGCA